MAKFAQLFSHCAAAFILFAAYATSVVTHAPLPDLGRFEQRSRLFESTDGTPLWGFLARDGRWRLSAAEKTPDPRYKRLLIAYEDKRFYDHPGVDVIALLRAALNMARFRSPSGGASTLTMQTVRLLEPQPRTWAAKLDQAIMALRLERSFSKHQILDIYMTIAPFGGNIDGVRAAAWSYLEKEPAELSLGEAALLVALPQAPEDRRPDHHAPEMRRARDHVIMALLARHLLGRAEAEGALAEGVPSQVHPLMVSAPHLAMRLRDRSAGDVVPTLIDSAMQHEVERLVSQHLQRSDEGVSIATIVIRNIDGAVESYVGGADLTSRDRSGFVDLVQSIRSPGSALKPFIYAMAFEELIVHPETIISDHPVEFNGYQPENADSGFMGDLSVRQALIRSRNTVAVMLLDKVGVAPFLSRFRQTGHPLALHGSDRAAGLAVALGGAGVSLDQLTWFYSAFANEGQLRRLRFVPSDPIETQGQFVARDAARAIADILGDVPPPAGHPRQASADGGRRIGFKTGTSFGFRDAWAVGFDRLHTVGVWVGRPDGAAHLGAYGITAAAPILMQVFDALPVPDRDVRSADMGLGSLAHTGDLPARLQRFEAPSRADVRNFEIVFPREGANITSNRGAASVVDLDVRLSGGRPPYYWTIAGHAQPPTDGSVVHWAFRDRGQLELKVIDSSGETATSSFWLE